MVGKPVGMRFYQHLNTDGSTLLFIQEDRPEWRSSNPGHNFIEGSPPADIRRTLHTSLNDPTTLWRQPPHNLPPHHDSLNRRHQLPKDWQLVESQKTAIICAALMPQYLWLATGGKSQFNNRLASLKGRKIIAFPDIDAYHDWLLRTADFPHLDLKVSDLLEKHATPEARAAHIDLADWLIEFLEGKNNAK